MAVGRAVDVESSRPGSCPTSSRVFLAGMQQSPAVTKSSLLRDAQAGVAPPEQARVGTEGPCTTASSEREAGA